MEENRTQQIYIILYMRLITKIINIIFTGKNKIYMF